MNDGYMGFIGMWCMLILLWSGWLDSVLHQNKLKKSVLVSLVVFWLLGVIWVFEFPPYGEIRAIPILLPLLAAIYLWVKEGEHHRLHIMTASFLVGVSVFLVQLLFRLDPILMFMNEKYLIAGFTVLLVLVTAHHIYHQFVLLSFGLVLSDLCFQIYVWEKIGYAVLGSLFFQDIWWIALYLLAVTRFVLRFVRWPSFLRRKRVESTG